MADIRGLDPQGHPRDVGVTNDGSVLVTSRAYQTRRIVVPGIGASSAYASGDAFGAKFTFSVPAEGTIATVMFIDRDDEGLAKELVLFNDDFAATTDNSAFAVSDNDLLLCRGVIPITTFFDFGNNQIGIATPAMSYNLNDQNSNAGLRTFYCQLVTRGVDNIAAGSEPVIYMVIV